MFVELGRHQRHINFVFLWQRTFATIDKIQKDSGVTGVSLLNFVVSDGWTMIATRFVSPQTEAPASLYYAEGDFKGL